MSASALFISEKYLKEQTPISGNVDVTLLLPHIIQAQDIYIQDTLGSKLYNALMASIVADNLTELQITLLNLIRPCLAYYTFYIGLPFLNYKIRNKGVMRQDGENTQSADISEVNFLRREVKTTAEFYQKRIQDYLCKNGNSYPEYTNPDYPMAPSRSSYSSPIYLEQLDGNTELYNYKKYYG